nr:MAG TPA: hypothetical protein [Caudoviricetes sp.]
MVFRQTHWVAANQTTFACWCIQRKNKQNNKYQSKSIDFCLIVWYYII